MPAAGRPGQPIDSIHGIARRATGRLIDVQDSKGRRHGRLILTAIRSLREGARTLVHFSANTHELYRNATTENMDLPPFDGQSFRFFLYAARQPCIVERS